MNFNWLLVPVLAVLYAGAWYLKTADGLASGVLGLGLLIGYLFLILDEYWGWRWYAENESGPTQLVTRSIPFLLVLVPLSLFVMTSTGSLLGMGLVIGLTAGLAGELWQYHRLPDYFHQRFLTQLQRPVTAEEITRIAYGGWIQLLIVSVVLFF